MLSFSSKSSNFAYNCFVNDKFFIIGSDKKQKIPQEFIP